MLGTNDKYRSLNDYETQGKKEEEEPHSALSEHELL